MEYRLMNRAASKGHNIAVMSFYDKSAGMGEEIGFPAKSNEVHGTGSFEQFFKERYAFTESWETKMWLYRPELCGINGEVLMADRQ